MTRKAKIALWLIAGTAAAGMFGFVAVQRSFAPGPKALEGAVFQGVTMVEKPKLWLFGEYSGPYENPSFSRVYVLDTRRDVVTELTSELKSIECFDRFGTTPFGSDGRVYAPCLLTAHHTGGRSHQKTAACADERNYEIRITRPDGRRYRIEYVFFEIQDDMGLLTGTAAEPVVSGKPTATEKTFLFLTPQPETSRGVEREYPHLFGR